MEQFIGKFISLNCGESLGVFQGQISHVDPCTQKLTLQKAFHNGCPYHSSKVIISAEDIKSLEMIEAFSDPLQSSTVKIKKPVAKKATHSPQESSSAGNSWAGYEMRESPRKHIDDKPNNFLDVTRTPSKKDKHKPHWRDEAAFGSPIDQTMTTDFDFEKNLALFNKKAFCDEMNASKPDVVRQTDKRNGNYRCDENVLSSKPVMFRQIIVPLPDVMEYVTDAGLVVPSIKPDLRRRVFASAETRGLTFERQSEIMGRAATEMALMLLGGAHRLNPHNHHQCPSVVVLCGAHRTGAQGLNSARQLASHGVRTTVYIDISGEVSVEYKRELALYKLTTNKVTHSLQDLCTTPVDLIILALRDSEVSSSGVTTPAARWANDNRAPVLALDPPLQGTSGVDAKYSLIAGLPYAYAQNNGKLYLCNIGIPLYVFQEMGIKYVPPFGPKFVIPLHLNNM